MVFGDGQSNGVV